MTNFGIGRIVVFVATFLTLVSFFLPWHDSVPASPFAVLLHLFPPMLENLFLILDGYITFVAIIPALIIFVFIFLVFIYPVLTMLIRPNINLIENFCGILFAVIGIFSDSLSFFKYTLQRMLEPVWVAICSLPLVLH